MNTRRTPVRIVEENDVNEEIPSQVEEVAQPDQVPIRGQANESTMTSRLGDFVRMNPPIFLGSKVGEDPQEFLDGRVGQVWYTQWKDTRTIESGHIEQEEFKRAFLGEYFLHVRRKVNIGRFIDFSKGKGNVEESKIRRSARILKRSMRALKKGNANKQSQPMFKKRDPNRDGTSVSKEKLEIGSSSQLIKPTFSTCRKRHHGKCLVGIGNFFGCGKDGRKVRDCPTIAARGREAKQVPPKAG
ncbi:hypothetical protein EJD97_023344 [Solanum chilense]|uniref:Uncharacterized protein n=1 Tax=Solanum chilense TaxID=4083 RepID=A0A6N2CAI4_SOLCI|nr:hypothetical protein EJD97_023344 [Solanum chilense]